MAKEISCGQLATAVESMRVVGSASRKLDQVLGELQHSKISIDADSFKHVQFYLDQIHRQLQPVPLQAAGINAN